jgi:Ca2+-transporting ATPase
LDALKDLSSPLTLVIRGGHRIVLPSQVVVRGDVVVLGEGVRRPGVTELVPLCDSAFRALPAYGIDTRIAIRSG